MPKISEAFPGRYLGAVDVTESFVGRVISVDEEMISGEKKLVMYISDSPRDAGIVLNKTVSKRLAAAWDDDTDKWTGNQGKVYTENVNFKGKQVLGIRVQPLDDAGAEVPY